jgi:type I restriction enzyme S subunit
MELMTKQGFKQTEVGLIPEDWDSKSISEISNPVRGGSPRPAGSPKYFNGDFIPWLTVASLTNIPNSQIFVTETKSFLTEAGSHLSRKLEKGTLIIANSGATLGVAKLLGIKCCANDGVAALQEIDKNVYPNYLVYYINTITKRLREDIATGNGQPNLNTELIGNIQIPIPPTLTEQKAIATALSDVDALITSLEQTITKKKAIKQGAMQQLLTPPHKGGKRLPGFSGVWVEKTLGEVVNFSKGKGLSKDKITDDGKNKCVLYGELFTTYKDSINNVFNRTDSMEGVRSIEGDILLPGSTTTTGIDLATTSCLKLNNVLLGGDINILRPKIEVDSLFLSRYVSHNLKEEILQRTQGITIIHLYGHSLNKVSVFIPTVIKEQEAISTILSDMDAEITQLESKKEKYQAIKQGMMQELLTGKTRLI